MTSQSLVIAIVFLFCDFAVLVECSEDEERLVRDLFRDYNKLIRPVEMMNKTLVVSFGLSFIQLINVNEKNQIMTLSNVWLKVLKNIVPDVLYYYPQVNRASKFASRTSWNLAHFLMKENNGS
ncbi:acetylcholine receptor subunit beta-like 1 [Tachypleus tridentatus]|uniref:acetylcholine receptor subunit beta-like 1 n=1 Tax=Tachypleus tridentatus TaxID=6853 RepID=UPI003FD2A5AC